MHEKPPHLIDHISPAKIQFALSLLLVAGLFIYAASKIGIENSSLAFDWKIIWHSIRNGNIQYGDGLYNPPWSLLFIVPLSFIPLQAGWGIWIFLTMALLIFSVPTDQKYPFWGRILLIFLLVITYPTLRLYADANVDGLIIGGIWLLVLGYNQPNSWLLAIGALITTLKPQAASLLLLIIAYYSWRDLPRQVWLYALMFIGGVVIFSLLWWGKAWLDATSSIGLYQEYGVSLPALLKRLNFPTVTILIAQIIFALLTLYVVTQAQTKFSQINIGFLIIGSLLISPYANTHSLVIVLAFGVAPLVLEHPFWGIPLFILYNAPFLTLFSGLPVYLAPLNTYWAVVLCISWFMLCWVIFRTAITKNTYHDFLEIRH